MTAKLAILPSATLILVTSCGGNSESTSASSPAVDEYYIPSVAVVERDTLPVAKPTDIHLENEAYDDGYEDMAAQAVEDRLNGVYGANYDNADDNEDYNAGAEDGYEDN